MDATATYHVCAMLPAEWNDGGRWWNHAGGAHALFSTVVQFLRELWAELPGVHGAVRRAAVRPGSIWRMSSGQGDLS